MKTSNLHRNRLLLAPILGAMALAVIVVATPEASATPHCANKGKPTPAQINQRVTNRIIERSRTVAIANLVKSMDLTPTGTAPSLEESSPPAPKGLFKNRKNRGHHESQVLLEVRIVELKRNQLNEFGTDLR